MIYTMRYEEFIDVMEMMIILEVGMYASLHLALTRAVCTRTCISAHKYLVKS